ncbi:MAG: Uma2 family endonuclease [Acidobacteria bacterium]|nr:MAG: Uma2 family endonuclease [Acidobacteriota bacterium]
MAVHVQRSVFTVDEYHRMVEAGILSEDDRVELIEGEIIRTSPMGSRHATCVKELDALLHHQGQQKVIISVQDPVRLDEHSEPEPDIALLKLRDDDYAHSHPTPEDVLLIIEVAETSAEYDRSIGLPLCARAGIPEVWPVNSPERIVEVYSEPSADMYQKFQRAQPGDIPKPERISDVTLPVDELFAQE